MSLPLIRPKALGPGARLAIVSPASAANEELVRAGMDRLRGMGYEPVLFPNALARGPLYYAGTVEQRVSDLHAAFSDARIDGIVCTRGGWGSAELLPYLDAALIRTHAKVFVGYSDHTSLHVWMRRFAGLVTFHGPMVAADFSRVDGADLASWSAGVGGGAWAAGPAEGLRMLKPGVAEGVFDGGCLSIFVEALGTEYAPDPSEGILFLEDVGTKPYQWDRQLLHLKYAGQLERVKGIVLGDMTQCVPAEDQELLERAILHALRDFEGPVGIGLRSGHVGARNVTLPLGGRARLEVSGAECRLEFHGSVVSE